MSQPEVTYMPAVMAAPNGHAPADGSASTPPPAASGPRVPRREVWVDVPDPYEGFRARIWVNYPRRFLEDIHSGDLERTKAALCRVVLAHNDWCDENGQALPAASTPEFWDAIPDELAAALIGLLNEESQKLPNAIAQRTKRR